MAFANPSWSDVLATSIQKRSPTYADNVSKSNALHRRLFTKGNVRTVDGGESILETLMFAENANAQFFSGYDLLNVSAQDVISAAQYNWSEAAVAIVVNGLELRQNSGKERTLNLLEGRMRVGEISLKNLISQALYSDGTAFGGKQLTGLNAAVPTAPTVGTYGGINRATFPFWQPQLVAPGAGVITASNINVHMNDIWTKCTRGPEHPDLIVADNGMWKLYLAFLQNLIRFVDVKTGDLGFPTVKFQSADVVLDGGQGGFCPTNTMFFLNTDYIFMRPHKDLNYAPLNPGRRYATNQDAEVQLIGLQSQMTVSNSALQGRLHNN
jgi:hypothetical protein